MEINVIPDSFEPPKDNYPFPSPFILSSVERYWCGNDSTKVVYIKRRHLEENLKTIAGEVGLDETESKKFLDYWCSPRGEELRAEGDPYFNLRQRAESWRDKAKPQGKPKQQSRVEKYAESARQFLNAHSRGESGEADTPDEQ